MAFVVGKGLAPQGHQGLEAIAQQGHRHPGARGQHQLALEAGIQQQLPSLRPPLRQVGAVAQHQNPGRKGPGERQCRRTLGRKQPAHRPSPRRQSLQLSFNTNGLDLLAGQGRSPAIGEGPEGRLAAGDGLGIAQPAGLPARW